MFIIRKKYIATVISVTAQFARLYNRMNEWLDFYSAFLVQVLLKVLSNGMTA